VKLAAAAATAAAAAAAMTAAATAAAAAAVVAMVALFTCLVARTWISPGLDICAHCPAVGPVSVQRDSSGAPSSPRNSRRCLPRASNRPLARLRREAYLSATLDTHDGNNRRQSRTYMRGHPTPTLVYFSLFLSRSDGLFFYPYLACDTMKIRNH